MNKILKAETTFSIMMTLGMVSIMLTYNMLMHLGFTGMALKGILLNFIPVFIGAYLIEQLIVNHNVRKVHEMIVSPEDKQFKKIMVYLLLMVVCMVLPMTLFAALINNVGSGTFWYDYLKSVAMNFPMALIAQFLVVGPATRAIVPMGGDVPSSIKTTEATVSDR